MNRKEQFRKRNVAFSDYETILSANAAAMSWVPWTKAYSFLPSLQATLSKPFKYTGLTKWQQRDIGVVSKDGINVSSESSGIKYGREDVNNDSGIFIGTSQLDQFKGKHERDNAAYKLVNDITSVVGGSVSSIYSIISNGGGKAADLAAKGVQQSSELVATEAVKNTVTQGLNTTTDVTAKGIEQGVSTVGNSLPKGNTSIPIADNTFVSKTPHPNIPKNISKRSSMAPAMDIPNNKYAGSRYDTYSNLLQSVKKGNWTDIMKSVTGESDVSIAELQEAIKYMKIANEAKQAKDEIKEDIKLYKMQYGI